MELLFGFIITSVTFQGLYEVQTKFEKLLIGQMELNESDYN